MPENKHFENLDPDSQQLVEKIGLKEANWSRPITPEDIEYLLQHWPFIQIMSTNELPIRDQADIYLLKTRWQCHDYGDALTTSPGKLLWQGGDYRINSDLGLVNPGKGTVVKQAFDSAAELAAGAKRLGWEGINIIDGSPMMQKFIAYHARWEQGLSLRSDKLNTLEFEKLIAEVDKMHPRLSRTSDEDQLTFLSITRPST